MADPNFPDVPPFPGVPPINRAPGSGLVPSIQRMTSDAPSIAGSSGAQAQSQWGIYESDGVTPVITGGQLVDAVLDVDYDAERDIPDYPIEQGSFESYNKVARPREMVVTVAEGGSKSERTRLLAKVETLLSSTSLYSVVQPERKYSSMNVIRVRYGRRNGPQLLELELFMKEVRLSAGVAFSNTQNPNDADAANQGNVAQQTPTTAQAAQITTPQ